jgi:hypothetical protein
MPPTLPTGGAQTDISRRSASSLRLDTEPRSDVDDEIRIIFTRSLDPKSKCTQGHAFRKRRSDLSDETHNVEPGPSKRLKTGFGSDYPTEELQQLLEVKYFGETLSNDELG